MGTERGQLLEHVANAARCAGQSVGEEAEGQRAAPAKEMEKEWWEKQKRSQDSMSGAKESMLPERWAERCGAAQKCGLKRGRRNKAPLPEGK